VSSDRDRWQRVRVLFDELIELDHTARRARLDEIGREDPTLREAVERLLTADASADAALEDYSFGSGRSAPADVTTSRDPLGVVGKTVAHFRVTGYLAGGGMGAVYTADDLRLGRTVALKFPLPHQHMDSAVKARFVNEARSAAALDHPNLCTVHEIGESEHGVFLAMPLYPGETLKDRLAREGALPVKEALAIARQIISGLASAHEAGIVHRDLKPGNVMLLPDGTVKVLDFGLAKIRDISLTKSHAALGTIAYIAPEQIRSEPVDARTDLWSMGVMLYEMLTGALPFHGEHEVSVIHAILHEEPPRASRRNPKVSPACDVLVDTLLQKDIRDRYRSAAELLDDITKLEEGDSLAHRTGLWSRIPRWRRSRRTIAAAAAVALLAGGALSWYGYQRSTMVAAADAGPVRAIAVLPFVDDDGNATDDHMAAGIELTALLERAPGIRLVARSSAAALQQRGLSPREIGRQLGVGHLVQGRIRIESDSFRLAVSVTRVEDDATIWTHVVAAPVRDAFAVERQIADGVLTAIGARRTVARAKRIGTRDNQAYELYLQGRYIWNQAPRTSATLERSLMLYRSALERDPEYAEAYAGMAAAYVNMVNFGYISWDEGLARSEVAADRALALDSTLADAYAARGFALSSRTRFVEAEASLQRAIELNPNLPWAHHFYAILLTMLNRLDEAKEATRRTLAIDPLSLPGNTMLGIEFAAEGDLTLARTQLRRALQLSPGFSLTLHYLGAVEAALGNYDEAREVLEQALAVAPDYPGVRGALAYVHARQGRTAEARRLLADSRNAISDQRTRVNYALDLALNGAADSAFSMLRTAQWDVPTLVELRHSPLLKAFRADPRYPQLLGAIGLRP
jgi:eukaryotic-like serine/threonine-protein kinase